MDVPRFNFIMLDGTIPANTPVDKAPDYFGAIEVLYGLSYTLKFSIKKRAEDPIDYAVMPLEGLWWTKNSHKEFKVSHDEDWYFTAMIMQPQPVTADLFEQASEQLRAKKNPVRLGEARFEAFDEGLSTQLMHLGPYADELANILRMIDFGNQNGYRAHGKHHEIYLNDPSRTKPERLRTVLRHPIEKDS